MGARFIVRGCLFDPFVAHRLAVVKDPYPPDPVPLLFFVGLMAIIIGASELVGTDVYASPHTVLVADAHRLPFEDGVFDGVWIQAGSRPAS